MQSSPPNAKRYVAVAAAAIVAALGAAPAPARAAEVTLTPELGQTALVPGKTRKVYLRVGLKGVKPASRTVRTPVNIAIVLDRSGSMQGARLARAKEAAAMAVDRLGPDDILALVVYNHEVDVLAKAARVTDAASLKRRIEVLTATGRTALHAGVVEGGREVERFLAAHRVNRVILLSDGLANVGPATPAALAELGRKLAGSGISVTTIGLGLEYNEDLMTRLAQASDGNHAFAEKPEDLVRIFDAEFGDVLSVVAQDAVITIDALAGFKPLKVLGRDARIEGSRITLKMSQLYGAQEKYVIVELEAPGTAEVGDAEVARVGIDYHGLVSGKRVRDEAVVKARFTLSEREAEESVNKPVMASVAAQIATVVSEQAVLLRDKGDIEGARRLLEDNAGYLGRKAKEYAAPALEALRKKTKKSASKLEGEAWRRERKLLRAEQYRSKVQQSY
ncbi:MAG: VWA domain-containing protein [Hyphomicrobiaceae bacterium]|nr:VWA domain-containing protein [Hyphomicrobiaceae bacterium]